MTDFIKGRIEKIFENPTKKGGTSYNVKLEILDGTAGEFEQDIGEVLSFSHGFDEPIFTEEDIVEFDVEWNGEYANFAVDTVEVVDEAPKRGRGRSSGGGRGSKSSDSRGGSSRSSGSRGGSRGGSKSSGRSSSSRSSGSNRSGGKGGGSRGSKSSSAASDKMSKDDWAQKDQYIRWQSCHNTAAQLVSIAIECGALSLPAKKADKLDAFIELVYEQAEALFERYDELVLGSASNERGNTRRGRNENEYDDDNVPD